MPKYTVLVQEIWVQGYTVEADSEEDARRIVHNTNFRGDPDEDSFEWSYTLSPSCSTVHLTKGT